MVLSAAGQPLVLTFARKDEAVNHHVSYAHGRQMNGLPHVWIEIATADETSADEPTTDA